MYLWMVVEQYHVFVVKVKEGVNESWRYWLDISDTRILKKIVYYWVCNTLSLKVAHRKTFQSKVPQVVMHHCIADYYLQEATKGLYPRESEHTYLQTYIHDAHYMDRFGDISNTMPFSSHVGM